MTAKAIGRDREIVSKVETKRVAQEKLRAELKHHTAGTAPIKITPRRDGTFDMSFHSLLPDNYTVDVFWGKVTARGVEETIASDPLAIQVKQDKQSVSFKPPNPELYRYLVQVSWDGKTIPGFPFIIDSLPPPMSDHEEVKCVAPIYSEPGKEAQLFVDTTNVRSGKINASCIGEQCGSIPVELRKIIQRIYQVTFVPPKNDLYKLNVLCNSKHVKGSPFKIDMRFSVRRECRKKESLEKLQNASKCILLDPPRSGRILFTGEPVCFSVDCRDVGPGVLKVRAEGTRMKQSQCNITLTPRTHDKHVYDVTFIGKVPSLYTLHLTWLDTPIPNTPIQILTIDPAAVFHCQYGKRVVIDFEVEGKSSDLNVFAISDQTNAQHTVIAAIAQRNEYIDCKLHFFPKLPGLYRIHTTINDQEIQRSPFIINCSESSRFKSSNMDGLNLECYSGEPMRFTVKTLW